MSTTTHHKNNTQREKQSPQHKHNNTQHTHHNHNRAWTSLCPCSDKFQQFPGGASDRFIRQSNDRLRNGFRRIFAAFFALRPVSALDGQRLLVVEGFCFADVALSSVCRYTSFLSPCQKQQQHKNNTTTSCHPKSALFCVTCCGMDLSEQPVTGVAQRRRQRRLRSWLRHERMTVAMALAERTHHSSRGQTIARAGVWGHELNCTATVREPSSPHTLTHTHTTQTLQPLRRRALRVAAGQDRYPVRAAGAGSAAHRAADRRCSPSGAFSR